VLWKKTSTGWKMFRDSFSSNRSVENKDQWFSSDRKSKLVDRQSYFAFQSVVKNLI
jgi:hypothetical protein